MLLATIIKKKFFDRSEQVRSGRCDEANNVLCAQTLSPTNMSELITN